MCNDKSRTSSFYSHVSQDKIREFLTSHDNPIMMVKSLTPENSVTRRSLKRDQFVSNILTTGSQKIKKLRLKSRFTSHLPIAKDPSWILKERKLLKLLTESYFNTSRIRRNLKPNKKPVEFKDNFQLNRKESDVVEYNTISPRFEKKFNSFIKVNIKKRYSN